MSSENQENKRPVCYLIDSYALAFRMFYAFQYNPLKSKDGIPTSVVFGYFNVLLRILKDLPLTHIAIIRDMPEATFRHEIYSQYKANRKEMPEEMKVQLPILDELLEMSGIPVIGRVGYEADDIMATLAKDLVDEGADVFLVTKDKDMMQVVNDHVKLFGMGTSTKPNEVIDRAAVIEKFDVTPEQIGDLLALMGDAADNIPGVNKVGVKTAAKLLNEYQNLDGIYANLDNIKAKALNANLTNYKDDAYLSKRLVDLAYMTDLDVDLKDLQYCCLNSYYLKERFEELNLNSLLRQLREIEAPDFQKVENKSAEFILLDNDDDLPSLLSDLKKTDIIAIDTETDSLNSLKANLVGVCISADESKGYYLPIAHDNSYNLDWEKVKKLLIQILLDKSKTIVMHNAKYDLQVLKNAGIEYGIHIKAKLVDTMVASYLLNPGVREHSLDRQVEKRLNYSMLPYESLVGKGKGQKTFNQVIAEDAAKYGAEDAVYTLRLWSILEPLLEKEELTKVFWELDMPLVSVLWKMEETGIFLDSAELDDLAAVLSERIKELEELIYKEANGNPFNIASPKQLAEVLFDDLGLPHGKKTKSGYSTDATVLEGLKDYYPIVAYIIEYRELGKLLNTYVLPLPLQINENTNRLHTSYSQVITATGRLSSLNPNLQNIPIKSEYGKQIRAAFKASDDDHVILAADYSQIELRVLAHLSQDKGLIEAYKNNADIHRETAAAIFGIFPEMVDEDMRRQAKAVNFGVIYGMSAFRLARDFKITNKAAQDFIDRYFEHYSGVTRFIEKTVETTRKQGYISTLFGRKRELSDIDNPNHNLRSHAERTAVNMPIQGSASDIIKMAMISLAKKIKKNDMDVKMLLQVHDELVFEVAKKDVEAVTKLVKQEMESVVDFDVPLTVDIGVGNNWLEAH